MKRVKAWKKLLSVVLSSAIVVTTLAPGAVVSAEELPSVQQSAEILNSDGTNADASADQAESSSGNTSAAQNEQNPDNTAAPDESGDAQDTYEAADGTEDNAAAREQQPESAPSEEQTQTKAAADTNLYQGGSICIYNEQQLRAIGNGAQVYEGDASADTFGTGAALTKEDGSALTYAADGTYTLMNDIPLTKGSAWTLPDGFAGTFNDAAVTEDAPLYDAGTDTIYVYNRYQLATINDPEALKTVMSRDMIAEDFGVGQVVYADADQTAQLEYTDAHNYVVSKDFTEEMPELTAVQVQADVTDQQGGRDFVGQVYKEIKGKTYILIGNEQQLREIGKATQVTPMLYVEAKIQHKYLPEAVYLPYYPGDADLNLHQGTNSEGKSSDFLYFENHQSELMRINYGTEGLVGTILGPVGDALNDTLGTVLRGILSLITWIPGLGSTIDSIIDLVLGSPNYDIVIAEGANYDDKDNYRSINNVSGTVYENLKYTSDANYIVFRDIDLNASAEGTIGSADGAGTGNGKDDKWTPLMISGNMQGWKNMHEGTSVTISHINVETGETLEAAEHLGVGFFGTISGQRDSNNVWKVAEPTLVKNINLSDVTISNKATQMHVDRSLIDSLLTGLGDILAKLLDGLTGILPGGNDLNVGNVIEDLLTLKTDDPDIYATGSFAGRVTGNVQIANCKVEGASVSNVKDITGGFVGYTEGTEEYTEVSDELKNAVDVLSKLLNIIPGLGLGDLIDLLLKKDIPLGELIPKGYYKPKFYGCSVEFAGNAGTIGTLETSYNGGFAGVQTGTCMDSCTVSGLTEVHAKSFAGGFAGLERDDTLDGALAELGVELTVDVQSVQNGCKVESNELRVTAAEDYAGGFNGCIANSISEGGTVSSLKTVTAGKDYAGGYTGRATIGYTLALGEDFANQNGTLIGAVSGLLGDVTKGDPSGSLLQTIGVHASEIRDFSIGGTDIEIVAQKSYAGGLIGAGDGTIIENSGDGSAHRLNLGNVSATEGKYAGGVAGALTTANGAGLLNEVIGLVDVQEYKASNIQVDVVSVTAGKDYAGGAFGLLTGGEVNQVAVDKIQNVTAKNYAGGFVGRSGAGSLAEAKGLDILGLGLVKAGNLVSIGELTSVDIKNCKVTGNGLTVSATGDTQGNDYFAGGFVSENNSGKIADSSVTGLKQVSTKTTGYFWGDKDALKTSYAGGFAARSQVGGLADVGAEGDTVGGLLGKDGVLEIDGLLDAVGYFIPSYKKCYVTFTDHDSSDGPQVSAAIAGGFIGEMQGGTVDNRTLAGENAEYAVRNAEYIEGTYYAGGFAGKILSGGLAQSDGLSLLGKHIDVSGLLQLIPTYIPNIFSAGVQSSTNGLKVYALQSDKKDVDSGSAGGYAGVTSGARISNSNVKELATKAPDTDTEPQANDYAVKAPSFAGGYVGKAEIGSAAAVGKSLSILDGVIDGGGLTDAIAAVESKFEGCDVYGKTGGFNVYSENGSAGGYAGVIEGSNFNDSDSYNFEYIKGVVSAGGYAGTIQPGNVASLAESTDVLNGLLSADNLLQAAQTFIPRIWNSETTAVPCGGYVKATGTSDGAEMKGLAGGYVGYNYGGQIKGEYECSPIFDGNSPKEKPAAAVRIRSVEGQEFAGGFTGLMEAANLAETGNLKLLWGLVKADNLLQAASAVYPTEENTKVTGPLDSMSVDVWKDWVDKVGSSGAYGDIFKTHKEFTTDDELNAFLADYTYGYTVKAYAEDNTMTGADTGGSAGGYVGRMEGGVITNGHAQDLKSVNAFRSAGGFAGEMVTGTIADLGGLSIGNLDVTNGLGVVKSFVPVIYTSRVDGYKSGFTVEATAQKDNTSVGNAGGFVGYADGAQIFDNKDGKNQIADKKAKAAMVTGLKTVTGHKNVGGFAGIMQAGAALGADTTSSNGLLHQILGLLISQDQISNLLNVLQATRTVVNSAEVNGYAPSESETSVFSVIGDKGQKADFAGGFAGKLTGALIGDANSKTKDSVEINGLKSVAGGKHVGGFFGLADVDGLVEAAEESDTSILKLIGLGNIDVLNAFRTYIYSSTVNGTGNGGMRVSAQESTDHSGISSLLDKAAAFFTGEGSDNQIEKDGNAGGFGGSLKDSSVVNCNLTNLGKVEGINYAGGFIGFTGKSGVVDADHVDVLKNLLGASAGVADIFGSQVKNSTLNSSDDNTKEYTDYTVSAAGGQECIAGGFIGYGDLARVDNCHAGELKQVYSDGIAGGFIGKTSYAYLVESDIKSPWLLEPVLSVVNELLGILYADGLQQADVIHVQLPKPFDKVLELKVLSDGDTLSVTLLGLKISVALSKGNGDGSEDVAQIHIGDSYIEVKCHDSDDGQYIDKNDSNISVGLIKANRTRVGNSTVSGISAGYDVFAGKADNKKDGSETEGYAGGFVGYNDEGLFETNQMYYADTIRGTDGKVGEFSGQTSLDTVYENINNLNVIEGTDNIYRVYRKNDGNNLSHVYSASGKLLNNVPDTETKINTETIDGTDCYVYEIQHRKADITESSGKSLHKSVWDGAYQKADGKNAEFDINVYVSDAQADLMLGTPTYIESEDPGSADEEMQDPCAEDIQLTIQKIWIDDKGNPVEKPDSVEFEVYQNEQSYKPKGQADSLKVVLTADDAQADSDSWVTTVSVPFKDDSGTEYSYSVKETPNTSDDYVTIYPATEEGSHLICVVNFQTSELVQEDSVVIDYGLPVDIDVLANDRVDEYGMNGTLTSVKNKNDQSTTNKKPYGTAEIETKADGKKVVEYTPTKMTMDSFDEFSYSVQINTAVTGQDNTTVTGQNNTAVVEGSLSIIPATEIYYEDNFSAITYADGKQGTVSSEEGASQDSPYANSGEWQEVKLENYSDGRHQDEDRPGTEELKGALDNIYGNDTSYTADKVYSGGSSHKVKVSLANLAANGGTSPKASFTFTGTGFDVISVTDGYTGAVRVTVKDAVTKKTVTSKSVNTYYGYTYSEEGGWQVQEDPTGALYQIPVIKIEGLDQGTYDVEIVPTYSPAFDQKDRGYYNFYLDAIRVYDPANPDAENNTVIKDAYQADGEYDSKFAELRKLLLNAGELTQESGAAPGVVFVDGNKEEADLSEYTSRGPNNEVYLMHDQAIAFYLEADRKPESIQLSAKLAMGEQADMQISFAVEETGGWTNYNVKRISVTSAYDMHYDISEQCMWTGDDKNGYRTKYPIIIKNATNAPDNGNDTGAVLSLTNLNWTSAEMPLETSLRVVTDRSAAMAAYSLAEVKPDQSITVQYLDTEGNILADAAVQNVKKGSAYDVTDLTNKAMEGYTIREIRGDAIQGTADTDKVIQVIYAVRECSIVVAYVDRAGNAIADPYVESVLFGEDYDVKGETVKKIRGYRQAEITGDAAEGIAADDVNITVIYDKEDNIVIEVVHTVVDTIVNTVNTVIDKVGNWLSSIFGR